MDKKRLIYIATVAGIIILIFLIAGKKITNVVQQVGGALNIPGLAAPELNVEGNTYNFERGSYVPVDPNISSSGAKTTCNFCSQVRNLVSDFLPASPNLLASKIASNTSGQQYIQNQQAILHVINLPPPNFNNASPRLVFRSDFIT